MKNLVGYIIIILLTLYIVWFIVTHSSPATTSDLIAVWGGSLLIFTWQLSEAKRDLKGHFNLRLDSIEENFNLRLNSIEENFNLRLNSIEEKVNRLLNSSKKGKR